jgi:hypothetical protein
MWQGVAKRTEGIAFLFLFAKLEIMTIAIKLYVLHQSTPKTTGSDRKP